MPTGARAVDRKVEQRSISKASILIQKEAGSPDLPRLKRSLCPKLLTCVPSLAISRRRIEF